MKNIILLATLFIAGCTTVKRYKTLDASSVDDTKVTMDLFGTKIEAAKEDDNAKSLWDLQAEGQAELIKSIDKRNTENEKFTSELSNKYLKGKEKTITDFTNKDLKLIFSIAKKRDYTKIHDPNADYRLADRIEYLKFNITIPDATNLNFIKWNKFTTEYASVDIADVTFSQSLEVTGSLGGSSSSGSEASSTVDGIANKATKGSSLTPSLGGKGTVSKTEAQKVRYRYMQLNGKISDKKISIEEEGMREIDLTGNVIADVNLKFDEVPEILSAVESMKDPAGAFNPMAKVKIIQYPVLVPKVAGKPETIDATLDFEYSYRHVVSGEKTFYEWDDKVKYVTGTGSKTITLFKKKDYIPGFAHIAKTGEDKVPFADRTRLAVQETFGAKNPYELIFSSNAAAADFLNWLLRYPVISGDEGKAIVLGPYKILLRKGKVDADLTPVEVTNISKEILNLPYYR